VCVFQRRFKKASSICLDVGVINLHGQKLPHNKAERHLQTGGDLNHHVFRITWRIDALDPLINKINGRN
jgi:hypothetical protein